MADQTDATTGTVDAPPAASDAPVTDTVAEAAKWKELSRKHEKVAKNLEAKLQAIEDSQKTETQKLAEERDALRVERDSLQQQALRARVALGKGLAPDLVDRLRGDTEDELSEDADRLLALLKPSGPHRFGDVDLGVRQTAPAPGSDEREVARSLFNGRT